MNISTFKNHTITVSALLYPIFLLFFLVISTLCHTCSKLILTCTDPGVSLLQLLKSKLLYYMIRWWVWVSHTWPCASTSTMNVWVSQGRILYDVNLPLRMKTYAAAHLYPVSFESKICDLIICACILCVF